MTIRSEEPSNLDGMRTLTWAGSAETVASFASWRGPHEVSAQRRKETFSPPAVLRAETSKSAAKGSQTGEPSSPGSEGTKGEPSPEDFPKATNTACSGRSTPAPSTRISSASGVRVRTYLTSSAPRES